jgi:hypothetical protein
MSSVEQENVKVQKYVSVEDYNSLRAAYDSMLNGINELLSESTGNIELPSLTQKENCKTVNTYSDKESNNIKYRYAASKINAMMWISVVLGFVSTCVAMASAQYQLTSELIVGSGLEPLVLYGMFSVIFTVCVVLVSIIYVIVLWCKIRK